MWRISTSLALMLSGSLAACTQSSPSRGPGTSEQRAVPAPRAWLDRRLDPDQRARLLVQAMNQDEKLSVVTGYFGAHRPWNEYQFAAARPLSAGFVPGVSRLGFTAQWQTDAGSGVAAQGEPPPEFERTLLPSGLLTASTWNPKLAEQSGAMIGSEARASGFNVMLAGGVNLLRDPGNGRNFEYGGEDPLLAGTMVGALVRGIQSNRIVSTVKHFAFNDQETGRAVVNVLIDEAAARVSDLLAFQIAIEQGNPGSVMCSYNRVNGEYACQNAWLQNQVLKRDWGFRGYVMADWGAQHDTVLNANNGLDQETGVSQLGQYQWREKLGQAIARGEVSPARLDDMVQRIARTLIEKGAVDDPVKPAAIDFAAHAQVAQADAEEGIVLLKNDAVLPLSPAAKTIAVIGGHADVGVLTGGGSAQVYAPGGNAVRGLGPAHWPGPVVYARSSPLDALRAEFPAASIVWADGTDLVAAAALAAKSDLAVVFATQWTAESRDFSVSLPDDQDHLIDVVAGANRHTVVVLETGGPVLMPWLDRVAGALEAWYPGTRGGPAIARILSGAVNPSGHLALTIPSALTQLPRPTTAGQGLANEQPFDVRYDEGAAVGYRWYDKKGLEPRLPFGHGLSYTTFSRSELRAQVVADELRVTFRVQNTGQRAGKDVALIFVSPRAGGWEAPKRLGAFSKVALSPGESAQATLTIDPRLLSSYDVARARFHIAAGDYQIILADSARDKGQTLNVHLAERWLRAGSGAAP